MTTRDGLLYAAAAAIAAALLWLIGRGTSSAEAATISSSGSSSSSGPEVFNVEFKTGVNSSFQPEFARALPAIDEEYRRIAGVDAVLTSGRDSTHKVGSLHYVGLAGDFRTYNLTPSQVDELRPAIENRLNSEFGGGYQVFWEWTDYAIGKHYILRPVYASQVKTARSRAPDQDRRLEHMHIEYDVG